MQSEMQQTLCAVVNVVTTLSKKEGVKGVQLVCFALFLIICAFKWCLNWNESSPISWETNVFEKWFHSLKIMWVQKLKFEVGVNSEVEQHSVSFLEDLDFTPLLLSRKKQICLFSVWIRKGEGLKKRNVFNTSCSLTQALHKFILPWAKGIRTKL